jgi:hypothetical protein
MSEAARSAHLIGATELHHRLARRPETVALDLQDHLYVGSASQWSADPTRALVR